MSRFEESMDDLARIMLVSIVYVLLIGICASIVRGCMHVTHHDSCRCRNCKCVEEKNDRQLQDSKGPDTGLPEQ